MPANTNTSILYQYVKNNVLDPHLDMSANTVTALQTMYDTSLNSFLAVDTLVRGIVIDDPNMQINFNSVPGISSMNLVCDGVNTFAVDGSGNVTMTNRDPTDDPNLT